MIRMAVDKSGFTPWGVASVEERDACMRLPHSVLMGAYDAGPSGVEQLLCNLRTSLVVDGGRLVLRRLQ